MAVYLILTSSNDMFCSVNSSNPKEIQVPTGLSSKTLTEEAKTSTRLPFLLVKWGNSSIN